MENKKILAHVTARPPPAHLKTLGDFMQWFAQDRARMLEEAAQQTAAMLEKQAGATIQ